ncbi:MAG: hypothetical protein IJM87_05075 [Ruminococcus sp.]|nr:hypothetical protein [Ruminococcus sp.]
MKKTIMFTAIAAAVMLASCGDSDSSSAPESKATTTTTAATESVTETETTTTTTAETTAKTTTTTEATTTTTAEETTTTATEAPAAAPASTEEYVKAIGEKIEITDTLTMAADMIGAVEGTSFKYNGNKFEIYKYNEGDPKLTEATGGSLTYEIEGFGEFTSQTVVNGEYVMLFNTEDSAVTDAFLSI